MAKRLKPPKHRFCPLCGKKLEKRADVDRTKRDICPDCGWVYYPYPYLSVTVLIRQNDQVLLVQRGEEPKKGLWQLPGGFIEFGEMPAETAAREVREETGLEIKVGDLIHLELIDDDPRGTILGFVYQGKVLGGKPRKDDEIAELKFFTLNSLPKLAFKIHRRLLRQLGGKIR